MLPLNGISFISGRSATGRAENHNMPVVGWNGGALCEVGLGGRDLGSATIKKKTPGESWGTLPGVGYVQSVITA